MVVLEKDDDAGDLILVTVVQVAASMLRETDLFARWGGEEFMVLCTGTDKINAGILAERIRKAIAEYDFPTVKTLTCSFGIADFTSTDDTESFLKKTDNALYQAKEGGRNRVVTAQ